MEEEQSKNPYVYMGVTVLILVCMIVNCFLLKNWALDEPSGNVPGLSILLFPFVGLPMLLGWCFTFLGFISTHQKLTNVLFIISLIIAIAVSNAFETSVLMLLIMTTIFLLFFKNIEYLIKD